MVTMAQRIEELRMARNMSRPALAAALGLPRTAVEKFETGRQTPTQAQQEQLAAFFGVSLFYLRGESSDKTKMEDWMDGAFLDAPAGDSRPAPRRAERHRRRRPPAGREKPLPPVCGLCYTKGQKLALRRRPRRACIRRRYGGNHILYLFEGGIPHAQEFWSQALDLPPAGVYPGRLR